MNPQTLTTYTAIKKGVIDWYNFGGRIGMWFDFMDGIKTIDEVINDLLANDEIEKADEMKVCRVELEAYMREQNIWEGGVLPMYR